MTVSSHSPSGNINAVLEIKKLIRLVAISINAPSSNINIVLEIYTYTPISIPLKLRSIYIPALVILSPNKFNLYAQTISMHVESINIQILSVTIIEQQQHGKFLRPVVISIQF